MTSYLADVNVWLAIAHQPHVHHAVTRDWFHALGPDQLFSCRLTQIGLLRLLTTSPVMGDQVKTQAEAWKTVDAFCRNARVQYLHEPSGVTEVFRRLTGEPLPRRGAWSDAYIAAVAIQAGLTVSTFDRDFLRLEVPALILATITHHPPPT